MVRPAERIIRRQTVASSAGPKPATQWRQSCGQERKLLPEGRHLETEEEFLPVGYPGPQSEYPE